MEKIARVTDAMVSRFLNWPVPETVRSDDCVTVLGRRGRIGTNLLTAQEARQMLEYVLDVPAEQVADSVLTAEASLHRELVDAYGDVGAPHRIVDAISKLVDAKIAESRAR